MRYWNRLIGLDDGKLTKHVFNHNSITYQSHVQSWSRNNWCSSVEDTLKELSLGDVSGNKTAVNNHEMIRLTDMYEEQSWHTRCMAKPKLMIYFHHKELGPEKYVTCHLSRNSDHT